MPHQAHLPQAGRVQPHQGRARRSLAWLAGLIALACLLLPPLAAAQTRGVDATCAPTIIAISAARAAPDQPDLRPASGWQSVSLPDQWLKRWPGYSGTVWYRIDWHNPCKRSVGVTINSISLAGALYLNDDLIWQDQSLQEPLSRSWNMPRYWELPASALPHTANTLWIRVSGLSYQSPGLGHLHLGTPGAMLAIHDGQMLMQRTGLQANLLVGLAMGLPALLIWLLYRRASEFGWYALFSFSSAVFVAGLLATSAWPFGSTAALLRTNITALLWCSVGFCLFTWELAGLQWPQARRSVLVAGALASAAVWLCPEARLDWLALPFFAALLLINGNCLMLQWPLWRRRTLEDMLLALWLLLTLTTTVHDVFILFNKLDDTPWVPWGTALNVVCMGLLLALRMTRNMRRIVDFNHELTEKVEYAREELRTATAQQHATELERSRLQTRLELSHDLHDGLGSSLVRAISTLERSEPTPDRARFLGYLRVLRDDLRQIIDAGTGAHIATPETPALWLAPTRHRFGVLFEEMGIHAEWHTPETWPLPPGVTHCMALTRVLEESLTNIVKHSNARNVHVRLTHLDVTTVQMQIEDDGEGFDAETVTSESTGIGMHSMRARISRLNGTLAVYSSSGNTCVNVWLPLAPDA